MLLLNRGRDVGAMVTRFVRLWHEAHTDADMHFDGFCHWLRDLEDAGMGSLERKRVLDAGCGDRAALSLLMAAYGASVDAIDLLPVRIGWGRRGFFWAALLREDPAGGLKQIVRDFVHTTRYWRRLQERLGRPLPFDAVRLRQMNAEHLDYGDGAFDLVISSAVWEHVEDVKAVAAEVNRVLAPDGLAVIQIALFPSLQGGHHAEWHSVSASERRTVRPWDHLREGRREFPVYLNQWRESQYRDAFAAQLDVTRWQDGALRGEEYLSAELEHEIGDYTRRDLLLPSVTVWARKKIAEATRQPQTLAG